MPEFMVEVYVSRADALTAASPTRDVSRVAAQITREGRPVRLVRSILVPEDETCLYLFRAHTGDAVRETATRAGLRFEHVAEVTADGRRRPPPRGDVPLRRRAHLEQREAPA
jgi:hypothetical protein